MQFLKSIFSESGGQGSYQRLQSFLCVALAGFLVIYSTMLDKVFNFEAFVTLLAFGAGGKLVGKYLENGKPPTQ